MKIPKLIPYKYIQKTDWLELPVRLRNNIRKTELEYLKLSNKLKKLYRSAKVK